MLRNTRLQRNGHQGPKYKSDNDMSDWCMKTHQDRNDHGVLWN